MEGDSNMLNTIRLEKYEFCSGRITTAVTVLGWTGIITSVISILVIAAKFIIQDISIPIAIIGHLLFIFLLIINIRVLIERNRASSFSGVKSNIQIICKFTLSLQLIVNILAMVTLIATKMDYIDMDDIYIEMDIYIDDKVYFVAFLLTFVWIVMVCLAIHGTRKNMKKPISVYIIFSMVWLFLQAYNEFLSLYNEPESLSLLGVISSSLKIIVDFLYNIGYFVVLYNIMDFSPDNCQDINHI